MRLFQQQTVYGALDNPDPVPPPPPPFLPNQEEEKRLCLLRESTTHLREGRQRLPTPDRVAIMELSSSFEKRRLGKQQQILSEITQRCREQEVTDLSSKISAKVDLKKTEHSQESPQLYTSSKLPHMMAKPRFAGGSLSTGDFRDLQTIDRRVKSEKGYKFFPARKIMRRQPSRLQLIQTTTAAKLGGGSGASIMGAGSIRGGGGGEVGGGGSTYRDAGMASSRVHTIDFLKGMHSSDPESRAQILERQTINGTIQLQHYIQPKLDAMAPLLLPDVQGMDGGFQDRIDSYFSSSRLALNQRSRSFYDTSSISGRSFRSLYTTGNRPTGSRHKLQSMRSERTTGPHRVLQELDDDGDHDDDHGDDDVDARIGTAAAVVAAARGESGGGEVPVPMDLRGSASTALRSEGQRV